MTFYNIKDADDALGRPPPPGPALGDSHTAASPEPPSLCRSVIIIPQNNHVTQTPF